MAYFEKRLTALVTQLQIAYPELVVSVQDEMAYYNSIREQVL
jgi:hypothetical protein